jgi:ABC-type lipoprotein export system ATPase subunit
LNQQEGLTIIMVTHNTDLVAPTDRVVRLVKGRLDSAVRQELFLPLHEATLITSVTARPA